ncbi:expressed unknown protein [Seminavis robusta]|uniref:Arf-GAP domain-containing protein n=1 Tax=Seminavis robusta TaxID=568900 RepID=A0A9N8ESA0_9STRA|nr:expressed unknown protein [Seminavis robusta]|eukprot:Sro1733_g294240.1 n/a (652) ;mRNA; r:6220-8175
MTSSTKSASTSTSSSGNVKKRPTADMTRRMAAVLRAKGNQVCADCPNTRPMWVSFLTTNSRGGSKHLGVLVCADCAQHHYFELGEKRCHIQYLKMAHEFSSLDIAVLEDAGDNDAVNRVLEATLTGDEFDKRYVDKDEKEEEKRRAKFIKHKYKKHKWIDQEKFHKLIVHLLKRERRRMQERFDDNVEEEERGEKRSSRRDCNNKPERSSSSRRLVERDRKGDHSTSSRRSSRQKDFHDSYPAEKSSSPKRPYMGSNRTSRSQRSLSAEELYPEDSRRPSMGSRKGRSQRSVHNSSTDLSAENSKRPSMSPKKNRTIRRGSNESLTPEDLRADTGTEASSSARPSLGPRGKSRRRKDFNDSLSLEDLSPALSSNSPAPSSDASRKGNLHRSCLNSKMEKPQEENETKQQVPPQPRQGQPTPRKLLPTRQASGRKGAGGFNSSCPNLSFAAHQFLQQDNKPQATNVTNIAGTPQRKLPARARSARDNNDNRGAPARGSSNPNLVLSRVRQARNNNATPAVASSRKAPFQPPMPLQSTTGPQPPRMRSNPNLMMGPPSAPQTTSRLQPTRMASNPNMMMMRPPSAAMQPPQMRPQPTRMGSNPNMMMMMRPPSAAMQPPQMRPCNLTKHNPHSRSTQASTINELDHTRWFQPT